MRVAAVDIGTNTALLLIAESDHEGRPVAVMERATITRLGQGVDRTRRLAPEAVARTRACLEEFAKLVAESGAERVAVVGTSAMRDAEGGDGLRSFVREAFGVDVRVLSGKEEARLTFAGALGGIPVAPGSKIAVFDIGGGSTEVVVGAMQGPSPVLDFAESFDVGSVRMTERLIAHDPPTRSEIDQILRVAHDTFRSLPPCPAGNAPVGVAGTVTTLAAVAFDVDPYEAERVHGRVLTKADLRATLERLAALEREQRRTVRGMEPKRADVIVAGGLVALALLDVWSVSSLVVSDRGVRWGLARELIASH